MFNFNKLTDNEVIQMYCRVVGELRSRGITRSKNVIGDLAERAVLVHYRESRRLPNLHLAPPSTASVDAVSGKGERYSIKGTCGSVTGVFHGLPPKDSNGTIKRLFDYAVIVRFDTDHGIKQIFQITWKQFLFFMRWHTRVKAWYLPVTKQLVASGRIIYSA